MITFLVLIFVCVNSIYAYSLKTNIITYDGSSHNSDWYGTHEDQEVEPGCLTGTFGYNYAVNLNFNEGTYTLYGLTSTTTLMSVYYEQNEHSNAFQYVNDGSYLGTGEFSYFANLSNSNVEGLLGGTHNILSLDLQNLIDLGLDLNNFTAHFAMGCGNDNLVGTTCSPVPELATILLFGSGLVILASFSRKKLS